MDILNLVNAIAWVGGNLVIAYIALALIVFVIGYYTLFDTGATTAGKMIFRFMLSLVGIVALLIAGIFIDPSSNRSWFSYPVDVAAWRPLIRLAIYGYVAFTITSLAILLGVRKWKPLLIISKSDRDLVKVRHTSEIPTIKE